MLNIKLNDKLSELFCSISLFTDQVLMLPRLLVPTPTPRGRLDLSFSRTLPFINFKLGRVLGVSLKVSKI